MKKLAILFSIIALFGISSCKKSSTEDPVNPSASNTFSIDGKNFTANNVNVTYRNGVFVFKAESSAGEKMILRTKLLVGKETQSALYEFKGDVDDELAIYVKKDEPELASNQYASGIVAGSISFTSFNNTTKKASGKFNVKVIRKTDSEEKVLKGEFNDLTFDDKAVNVPSQLLTAMIGANSFTATTITGKSTTSTKILNIKGVAANDAYISLNLPYKVIEGTYKTAIFGSISAEYSPSIGVVEPVETGIITVNEHDPEAKIISGTFDFNTDQQTTLKQGSFVCVYK
ncbi:MAG: hypothetical protein H6605_09310 [Flavobacteriales bacterium]|nr:hypothetical protein [Flavobacteriales bacterium]